MYRRFLTGAALCFAALVQAAVAPQQYEYRQVPVPENHQIIDQYPQSIPPLSCALRFNAPGDTAFIVDPGLQLFNVKDKITGRYKPFLMSAALPDLQALAANQEGGDDYFIAESDSLDLLVGMKVGQEPIKGSSFCLSEPVIFDRETLAPEPFSLARENTVSPFSGTQTQIMFSAPNGLVYYRRYVRNRFRYGFLKPNGAEQYTTNFLYGGPVTDSPLTQPVWRNSNRFAGNFASRLNEPDSGYIGTFYLILGDSAPYLYANHNFHPVDLLHQAVGWKDGEHYLVTSLAELPVEEEVSIDLQGPNVQVDLEVSFQTNQKQLCLGTQNARFGPVDGPETVMCQYYTRVPENGRNYIPRAWSGSANSLFVNIECRPGAEQCARFTLYFTGPGVKPQRLLEAFPELRSRFSMQNPVVLNTRVYDSNETIIVHEAQPEAAPKTVVISSSSLLNSSSAAPLMSTSMTLLSLTLFTILAFSL